MALHFLLSFITCLTAAFALLSVSATAAPVNISAQLIAEEIRPNAGRSVRLAIQMTPNYGWHGYWQNPGDSGMPPEVKWTLPNNAQVGPLRHPVPITQEMAGFVSYIYDGPFTLLTSVKVPADLAPGSTFPIRAKMSWLACSDTMCVPEKADLALDLVIASGNETSPRSPAFKQYENALPRAFSSEGIIKAVAEGLELSINAPPGLSSTSARLFPITSKVFPASKKLIARREGDRLVFTIPSPGAVVPPQFEAVIDSGRGSRAYTIIARAALEKAATSTSQIASVEPLAIALDPYASTNTPAAPKLVASQQSEIALAAPAQIKTSGYTGFLLTFLGAVLGGLLLNLMPCVFPILSLKALSLARSSASQGAARIEGFAYTAGAVSVAAILGALLVGLRAAGSEIGWAFQLQNPYIILLLAALMSAIGLNLCGAYELRSVSVNGALIDRKGPSGAFMTGGLAAFIATPCSGPFMGVAIGAALVLPAPSAVGVFAGLGLGLALPFLAVGLVPALRTRLPKPGKWMVTLRRILSVPMFLTAAALIWVLSRQTGNGGLIVGSSLIAGSSAGLIWLGLGQRKFKSNHLPLVSLAVISACAFFALPPAQLTVPRADQISASVRPFSEANLSKLRVQKTPVFVDFTADWCLTCKVNEKTAINTSRVQRAFKDAGVITLIGDWTNADPAISAFLAKHQRNSIPFYLFYGADGSITILPQILSPALLEAAAFDSKTKKEAAELSQP